MKTRAGAVVLFLALAPLAWGGALSVGYLRTIHVNVPGATAAYSLDPLYAEASAVAGDVAITGKNPGDAKIIVVTPAGVETLSVTTLQPPPSYPPGFVPPTAISYFGDDGSYEFRYSSDPSQWVNNLNFVRRQGSRRTELRMTNANLLRPDGDSPAISFPLLSYSVSTPRRGFTVLDEMVDNSALTLDGALVRGFHYWQGGWSFHAGVASQTTFHDFLLSTDRQEVAGVSRGFRPRKHAELTANMYVFHAPAVSGAGRSGPVASLVFRYKPSERFHYWLEIGGSHGVAAAGEMEYGTGDNHLHASFRQVPTSFAGLNLNQVRGSVAQADWSRRLTRRLAANVFFSRNRYELSKQQNANLNSSAQLRYQIVRYWSVNAGVGESRFSSSGAVNYQLRSMTIPLGTDVATAHFGAGVQYQINRNPAPAKDGYEARANVRVGWGAVQASAFVDQQIEAPRLQLVLAPNSPLADSLTNQTVLATTPGAIAAAMQDNAVLANLGYLQSATVALAQRRRQFGGNLTWMRRTGARDQFTYNFLHEADELLSSQSSFTTHTLTYSRQVTPSNEAGFSLSLFDVGPGPYRVRYQFNYRHHFATLPSFFAPNAHGGISGYVFRDDSGTGEFVRGMPVLEGAEVVLDAEHHARTDGRGFYMFQHVAAGPHRLEVLPHAGSAFYFTTPSVISAEINSQVNFGIAFALGHVFGAVLNDSGAPVAGVTIRLKGPKQEITLQSGDNGHFDRNGVAEGSYAVAVDVNSVPPGYFLGRLESSTVNVEPGNPAEVDFQIKAMRAIVGRVLAYDARKTREVPVNDVVVTLKELHCAVIADKNGVFRFRDLPAGRYTVAVVYRDREIAQEVALPGGPALVSDLVLRVGAK